MPGSGEEEKRGKNPENLQNPRNLRLHLDMEKCMRCGACVAVCPVDGALILHTTYLEIVHEKCVRCGQCVTVCPMGALSLQSDRP